MIKFSYNKEIDIECHKRLVEAGEMFGTAFPKDFIISDENEAYGAEKAIEVEKIWKEWSSHNDFDEGMKKIYKHSFLEDIPCYINTSKFSMDNFEKGYISVSAYRGAPEKFVNSVIHEASHFLFRKYYKDYCLDLGVNEEKIEDIKEILTVINNEVFVGIEDKGYLVHDQQRKQVLEKWRLTDDIKDVIEDIVGNIK